MAAMFASWANPSLEQADDGQPQKNKLGWPLLYTGVAPSCL
jgi:hypothetical protein